MPNRKKQAAVPVPVRWSEPTNEHTPLRELLHVIPPEKQHDLRSLRVWLGIAAAVNFVATVPFLVNSVLHHVDDVPTPLIDWAQETAPNRPFVFWTFLSYGALWGCFFIAIAVRPVERRAWLKVAMAEKLVTTIAVWTDYVFVADDVRLVFPLLILVTDLAFVFVFAWALGKANRLAVTPMKLDGAIAASAARIPAGSSPPARWSLRFSALVTLALAITVLISSVIEVLSAPASCFDENNTECAVLGTDQLWSVPPLLVWIWAGMEIVISATMLWASADVVRRRAIIPYGIFARLIPVAAVIVAQFSRDERWDPSNGFTWWVVGVEGGACFLTWVARRWANASAITLGTDIPARVEPAMAPT